MKRLKFCEEQIVRILKEVEVGAKGAETCRKHGIGESTYYVWKSKYTGMEVSQLRHLKDAGVELAPLKRMYADLALEHHVRAVRSSSREKAEAGAATGTEPGDTLLSSARCDGRTLGPSRSARHYDPRIRDDSTLIGAIEAHLKEAPGYGFGLLFDQALQPRRFGKTSSWRVYVAMKHNLPRRGGSEK